MLNLFKLKKMSEFMLVILVLIVCALHANAQTVSPSNLTLPSLTFSWSQTVSATPIQIGVAEWRGHGVTSVGAASCLTPFANYGNGAIHFGLGEICGAVGGTVTSNATGESKLSMPLTLGASFYEGPLSIHGGYGPDILGTPVGMVSITYPF